LPGGTVRFPRRWCSPLSRLRRGQRHCVPLGASRDNAARTVCPWTPASLRGRDPPTPDGRCGVAHPSPTGGTFRTRVAVPPGAADLARFQTEAEAIARLQHPNIVQVYEIGEHEGKPFFALEFCGGGSLEKKLNGTPLPAREAAALVETLARAMQAAHEQHVIHRDLKPANVLLAEDGTPKITDFGLAKKLDEAGQTHSGAIVGT